MPQISKFTIKVTIALAFGVLALAGPLWGTASVLSGASTALFSFTSLSLRALGHLIVAFVPVLLVIYVRRANDRWRDFERDLYPCTVLFSLAALALGIVYFGDSYTMIMSEGEAGPHIAIGVARVGDIHIPSEVLVWGFAGAWVYVVQDFLRRIREGFLSTQVIISSSFRIVLSLATSLLWFSIFQSTTPAFEFQGERVQNFVLLEEERVIVPIESVEDQTYRYLSFYTQTVTSPQLPYTLAALCFFSGMYPRRMMRRGFKSLASIVPIGVSTEANLSLIQGLTLEDEERLIEEGFDSTTKIAYADRDLLSSRTQYPKGVLADWVSQAQLIGYFNDKEQLAQLRAIGIRSIEDINKLRELGDDDFADLSARTPSIDLRLFRQ